MILTHASVTTKAVNWEYDKNEHINAAVTTNHTQIHHQEQKKWVIWVITDSPEYVLGWQKLTLTPSWPTGAATTR